MGEAKGNGGPETWPWRLANAFPRNMRGVHQGKGLDVREQHGNA